MGIVVSSKNFFFDLLDFFIPNLCLICNEKINRSLFSLCDNCLKQIEVSNQKDIKEFFENNLASQKLISNFYSKYVFVKDGLFQKIVHELKYNGKSRIGILLGIELGKDLLKQNWFNEIDFIVPVPIHLIKKLNRGFNQSLLIAKGIYHSTGKAVNEKIIKRIRNTETQTHLHLHERIENVKDAFKVISKEKVIGKNILIIDDVCTTGSTVNEVARTLLNAGANKISLSTLAFVKEKDFSLIV
ncbi:MAG: ComF family protein [Ignavibacteria bacterium]|nr:ComF family protein [Ignavibacteria bacterium]